MDETRDKARTKKDMMLILERKDVRQQEYSMQDEEIGQLLNEMVGFDAKDFMLMLIKKKRLADAERERRYAWKEPMDAAER